VNVTPEDYTSQPDGEDALNRVLADFLDALGKGSVDLAGWQLRYPAFALELNELFVARQAVGKAYGVDAVKPDGERSLSPTHDTDAIHKPVPATESKPSAPIPVLIGDCELLEELGQGGMGRVYRAWQRKPGRFVALKVFRPGIPIQEADRLRFRTEAEAAGRLDHPNIVPVYEVGEHERQPYLVMRYIAGGPLSGHLQRFRGDSRATAGLVVELARALDHAHQHGVLHRDLKPGNVLLEWRHGADGAPIPHITDFGLARLLDQESGITKTGELLGTPSYMAPEQAGGQSAAITTATDVYGLGAIFYAMLTGRPPFAGSAVLDTLELVKGREPDPPRLLNACVERDLETICLKCLSKDPRRRYGSALALAEDLENWLSNRPITARPVSHRERLIKWVRRHPAALAFASVASMAIVASLVASMWHSHVLGVALAESDHLRREGLEREANLRDFLYVADMRLAKEAWDSGDLPHLAELLEHHRPTLETDRRGFEWHWLNWCLGSRTATLNAHDGGLLCASVSPDDRYLVTGDRKGAVKVWSLANRQLVTNLVGHSNEVHRAIFSPDSSVLATCSSDGSVRLWDVPAWKQRECLFGHKGTVTSIAFSPEGKLLASVGRDFQVILRELPSGRPARAWAAHRSVIQDVHFISEDSLVTLSSDRVAKFWKVSDGSEQTHCRYDFDPLCLAHDTETKMLATAGYGNHVAVCSDRPNGERTFDFPVGWTARALAYSPDGGQLAAVCDSGMLRLWQMAPGGRAPRWWRTIHRGAGNGRAATFARHGSLLLTGGEEDGTVDFWDPVRLSGWKVIPSIPSAVRNIAVLADGRPVSVHSGQICLWDPEACRIDRNLPLQGGAHITAFSPCGLFVATARWNQSDPTCRLWQMNPWRELVSLDHGAGISALAFSPDGRLLATAGENDCIRIWDIPSGTLRSSIASGFSSILSVAFAPGGRSLVVAGRARNVFAELWELQGNKPLARFTDGRPLPDPAESNFTPVLPEEYKRGAIVLAISSDGSLLAAGCRDGIIRLWDIATGEPRNSLSAHTGPLLHLAFAQDGRTIASIGDDHVLKLWHTKTGQRLFNMDYQNYTLAGLAFSRDGRLLVAAAVPTDNSDTHRLVMWRAEPEER
jgi:WD40 repeat protein